MRLSLQAVEVAARMFHLAICRKRILLALPALVCLQLSGCINTGHLKQDVMSARRRRFQQWKLAAAGLSKERILLEGPLSMSKSVLIALRNSHAIQQVLEDEIGSNARIQEAWAEALPSVELGAGYMRLDRTPRAGGAAVGDRNNFELNTTLRQPIWHGGAIRAGIRAADIFAVLTDERVRGTVQQVIYDVRKAYLDARLAFELERASKKSVEAAARQLQDVKKDKEAGLASAFDVLRADVQLKNFEAANVQAQNRHNLAVTTLLNVMNTSQDSRITIKDDLQYRPVEPKLDEAVEQAFMNHPDLLESEYNRRLRQELLAAEKAGYYPLLDLLFTGRSARPNPHKPAHTHSFATQWETSLSLSYPLFEGFRTVARVKQAKVALRKSAIDIKETEERILLDIRQAILSIHDSARFVESQQANVEQAEEALRLVRLGRRQGIRREVEVLDAQSALDKARANYYQAVYNHEIARLDFERAIGALELPRNARLPR